MAMHLRITMSCFFFFFFFAYAGWPRLLFNYFFYSLRHSAPNTGQQGVTQPMHGAMFTLTASVLRRSFILFRVHYVLDLLYDVPLSPMCNLMRALVWV